MIAFDTNILTEVLLGTPSYVNLISAIPVCQQSVPIIVVEEIMRGRLNTIRRAETGKSKARDEADRYRPVLSLCATPRSLRLCV